MPIYEYQCSKCGNVFDLMRRLAARDDAAPCPECKSKRVKRRTIQNVAILSGARPDAFAGEGESEDFLDGADDHFGGGHDHGLGGMDDWDDDF